MRKICKNILLTIYFLVINGIIIYRKIIWAKIAPGSDFIMLCPVCKKAEGTLEVTKIIGGEQISGAVCCDCYSEAERLTPRGFYHLFVELPEKTCPSCGRTYGEFAETLLLGCPLCYKTFETELAPLIRSIQPK